MSARMFLAALLACAWVGVGGAHWQGDAVGATPAPEVQEPGAAKPDLRSGLGGLNASGAPPEVIYDASSLPPAVRRTRDQIMEAARSGRIEKLRPVIEANEVPPALSLGDTESRDPIEVLRENSEDGEGYEILAILLEVLESGYVLVEEGTPQEMYVWPYFAHLPLEGLTPEQKVELFRLVTSYDYNEMVNYGAYIFYRLGIGPDGTWHFFLAGD